MRETLRSERRLLGLVNQVNRLLLTQERESVLFPKVCQAMVEEAGFSSAWVGCRDGIDNPRLVVMGRAGQAVPRTRHTVPSPGGAAECALVEGKAALGASSDDTAGGELALPMSLGEGRSGVLVVGFPLDVQLGPETVTLLEGMAALMGRSIIERAAEVDLHHAQRVSNIFLHKFETSLLGTVQAMATALEKRDPYTAGHQRRVARLSTAIGRKIGLSNHRLQGLQIGALIHDIGKIQVPAEILAKPGRLREEEMNLIRIHPTVGYEMVRDIDFPWPIGSIIVQHHERMDGSGYPSGLAGDKIALESRIVAVADVVEAMAAHRPYRPNLGIDAALDEIRSGREWRYDANVVDVCCELFTRQGVESLFGETTDPGMSIDDVAASKDRRTSANDQPRSAGAAEVGGIAKSVRQEEK